MSRKKGGISPHRCQSLSLGYSPPIAIDNDRTSCFDFLSGQPDTVRTFWLAIGRLACRDHGVNVRRRVTVNRSDIWFELPTAPRVTLYSNQGLVELGAFRTKRLRRLPHVEMFKWNSIVDQIQAESESAAPKPDRMRLALYYQSLLDCGEVSMRAELARFLGVSRARVTQVLNRLNDTEDEFTKRRFGDTG